MGKQNIHYLDNAAVEGVGLEYDLVRVGQEYLLLFQKLNPVVTLWYLRAEGYIGEVGVESGCVVFDKGHYSIEIQLKLMNIYKFLASFKGLGIGWTEFYQLHCWQPQQPAAADHNCNN